MLVAAGASSRVSCMLVATNRYALVLFLVLQGCVGASTAPIPPPVPEPENSWRGLVVEAENACAEYNPDHDYGRTPASLEAQIVERMRGRIYGPYTGTYFESTSETDMEVV